MKEKVEPCRATSNKNNPKKFDLEVIVESEVLTNSSKISVDIKPSVQDNLTFQSS
jgi:hypothetical protein